MEMNLSFHIFNQFLILFLAQISNLKQTMEKWMIVYLLPLEVWVEIFSYPWISRLEFGYFVARIGNFKFAEHAQFYLHEWGKHKLYNMYFHKEGLCIDNVEPRLFMDYPQTPLPANIKSFHFIEIKHFDAQTMDFFDKIRPLLTGGLKIAVAEIPANCLEALRTILSNLAPMLEDDGIHSLCCQNEFAFPVVKEHFFRDNAKLAKLKRFEINIVFDVEAEQQTVVAFIMDWLAQPDRDGPRLLHLRSENDFSKQIFETIRKEFLLAKTPRTFAVNLEPYDWEEGHIAEFHSENSIGEVLHGKRLEEEEVFEITRHQANCSTDQAREWIEEMTKECVGRSIWFDEPTIGTTADDAVEVDVPHMDEEQAERAIDGKKRKKDGHDDVEENDDADKPCSSKKMHTGK